MASTKFFVMLKPDAINRGLVGKILSRFEEKGFKILRCRLFDAPFDLIEKHYVEHADKSYYKDLIDFTMSGTIVGLILEGNIKVAKKLVGETLPWESLPGTIRGDYSSSLPANLIHCSASPEAATREVGLWDSYLL
jgi:nucleoside-diphosphate kinase